MIIKNPCGFPQGFLFFQLKNFFVSNSGVAVFKMDYAAFFKAAFFKKFLHSDVVFVSINADGSDFFNFADFVCKTHKSGAEAHSMPVGVDSETVNNKIVLGIL